MSSLAFVDDSFAFDGVTLREKPLGGIQVATVMLAEAMAARGHHVTVFTPTTQESQYAGVSYRPFSRRTEECHDAVIVNCAPKLFKKVKAKRRALWMHGPARYMRKPRHFLPYFRARPVTVFTGAYHRASWLRWLPLVKPVVIPHGVGAPFTVADPALIPPPPRAIFTSNPRRGLDWLLDIWVHKIRPRVPTAELHVFSGRATYGYRGDDKIEAALAAAQDSMSHGVLLREPVGKEKLADELRQARVMLYRGDLGETFCFAAAEAQAMGVPLVTAGVGALAERVVDRETGFLAGDSGDFAAKAVALLTDDPLWASQHKAALARRGHGSWDERARAWEKVLFA